MDDGLFGLGDIQAQGSRGKETSGECGGLQFSVSAPQSHFLAGSFSFALWRQRLLGNFVLNAN